MVGKNTKNKGRNIFALYWYRVYVQTIKCGAEMKRRATNNRKIFI